MANRNTTKPNPQFLVMQSEFSAELQGEGHEPWGRERMIRRVIIR